MTKVRTGTFIKTGSPHVVEVLALSGLDFGIVDAEHGPYDRAGIDLMMLASRASGLPLFVRVQDDRPATLLWALDLGAAGLVVPHVDTAAQAETVVRNARFRNGARGFSNSARFGRYGTTTIEDAMKIGDAAEIFCQIESAKAVENAAAIAAVPGVAGLLIGRADLALSMGLTRLDAPEVAHGARRSIAAARAAGKSAAIVTGGLDEVETMVALGVDMFVIASDQGLMRRAAQDVAKGVADIISLSSGSSS